MIETKIGRLRTALKDLLTQHELAGTLPTSARFLFYELEQQGVVPKHYVKPSGEKRARTPAQDISDATMRLRELDKVPWWWILDESRDVREASRPKRNQKIRASRRSTRAVAAATRVNATRQVASARFICIAARVAFFGEVFDSRAQLTQLGALRCDHLAEQSRSEEHAAEEQAGLDEGEERPVAHAADDAIEHGDDADDEAEREQSRTERNHPVG